MVKKLRNLLFPILILSLIFIPEAQADVFSSLKGLAEKTGNVFIKVGYMVAGIGLLAFAVAAIFNKISWKTLAYIMMSTFILSLLASHAISNYVQKGFAVVNKGNGVSGSATPAGNTQSNKVQKSGK